MPNAFVATTTGTSPFMNRSWARERWSSGNAFTFVPVAGLAAAFRIYPDVLAGAFSVTVLVGILAGLVPAIRSVQRPIADGLRLVA